MESYENVCLFGLYRLTGFHQGSTRQWRTQSRRHMNLFSKKRLFTTINCWCQTKYSYKFEYFSNSDLAKSPTMVFDLVTPLTEYCE
jgi:hypothetical protein